MSSCSSAWARQPQPVTNFQRRVLLACQDVGEGFQVRVHVATRRGSMWLPGEGPCGYQVAGWRVRGSVASGGWSWLVGMGSEASHKWVLGFSAEPFH